VPWGWFAEQPPLAAPSWVPSRPEAEMWGFRSPSHAPCPEQAWPACNPAATQFPLPRTPADKHSQGEVTPERAPSPADLLVDPQPSTCPSGFEVLPGHPHPVRHPPSPDGCPTLSQSHWRKDIDPHRERRWPAETQRGGDPPVGGRSRS